MSWSGDPMGPDGRGSTTSAGDWHRLHPLSPLLRGGRALSALLLVLITDRFAAGASSPGPGSAHAGGLLALLDGDALEYLILGGVVVLGVVNWVVTRWCVEGGDLRIETGLLRRRSRRVPLTRLQAVDVVRPFLARVLGLAELRLSLAGMTRGDTRLSYLSAADALRVRAQLLALAHGVPGETAAPAQTPLLAVPPGRLLAATLLRAPSVLALLLLALAPVVVSGSSPATPAYVGTFVLVLLAALTGLWRRVTAEFGFQISAAPDGLHLRSGLLNTRTETIPRGRIQACRLIEPALWRPFGWCRLEADVAGGRFAKGRDDARWLTSALLPVGPRPLALALLERVLPGSQVSLRPPPGRARWKAPLSAHFLAAGHDARYVVAATGRITRTIDVVPLAKIQSLRWSQGPLQRRLRLATLGVHVAGRKGGATCRERDAQSARTVLEELAAAARAARAIERRERVPTPGGATG